MKVILNKQKCIFKHVHKLPAKTFSMEIACGFMKDPSILDKFEKMCKGDQFVRLILKGGKSNGYCSEKQTLKFNEVFFLLG